MNSDLTQKPSYSYGQRFFVILSGGMLLLLGSVLFASILMPLSGVANGTITNLQVTALTWYALATAGSFAVGLGFILVLLGCQENFSGAVNFSGAFLVFFLLGSMRLAVVIDESDLDPLRELLIFETVIFFVISWGFVQSGLDGWKRLKQVFFSLGAAPIWVQIWVWLFLAPVNVVSFCIYWISQVPAVGVAAIAFWFVVLTNMATAMYERGISKLTSLPHLIAWVPAVIYVAWWMVDNPSDAQTNSFIWGYLSIYLIINLISIGFDAYDIVRWVKGDRDVLGASNGG